MASRDEEFFDSVFQLHLRQVQQQNGVVFFEKQIFYSPSQAASLFLSPVHKPNPHCYICLCHS